MRPPLQIMMRRPRSCIATTLSLVTCAKKGSHNLAHHIVTCNTSLLDIGRSHGVEAMQVPSSSLGHQVDSHQPTGRPHLSTLKDSMGHHKALLRAHMVQPHQLDNTVDPLLVSCSSYCKPSPCCQVLFTSKVQRYL